MVTWGKPVKAIGNLAKTLHTKNVILRRGGSPPSTPAFPPWGCVCVRWRACARVCMHGCACVGVCVCELSSACACARVLRVCYPWESIGKRRESIAARWLAGLRSMLAFFCSLVNSLACHLSAYGYLLAIHLITCGVYDALCYPLAIHMLTLAIMLLSSCYPIDLRSIALASLRSIATIGNVS